MMKLVFDCTSLANWVGHPTGIQRVVIETGSRLCALIPNAALGLFDASGNCLEYDLAHRTTTGVTIDVGLGDVVVTAGSNWDWPEHQRMLVSLQETGVRVATLFYDIIPLLLPHSYGPGFSAIYERWFREAVTMSDLAFSISENTRTDILHYAKANGLPCPDVHTVRLGDEIPSSFEPPSAAILEKTASPYILSVGTLEYRKNHVLLLNAYRYMIDVQGYTPPPLFIVGKKGWLDHDIEYQIENDPRLSGLVSVLKGISDADLQCMYERAMFTVYPSFYEGWGLPVAESLCFGKPCVASGTSSMVEIAPGLVRHAHPLRLDEWVTAIREYAEDSALLIQAADAVRSEYARKGWEGTAASMNEILVSRYPDLLGRAQ